MKYEIASIAVALTIASCDAFSPASIVSRTTTFVSNNHRISKPVAFTNSQLFSQWDEEEEVKAIPSFEEAAKAAADEDDQAELDEMGEFDLQSSYDAKDVDRYREAIKQRAAALGMKPKTPEEIAAEEAMKMEALARDNSPLANMANAAQEQSETMSQQLDLSQITMDAPRDQDDDLPAIMYDPAKDMTEEEMKEADPLGFEPIPAQVMAVVKKGEFPSFGDSVIQVFILVAAIFVTGLIIVSWDDVMRDLAMEYMKVPKPGEAAKSMEGMVLPDDPTMGGSNDMLQLLQNGVKGFGEGAAAAGQAIKDGTLLDQLASDVPQDL